jgi:hypothetical protein
MKLNPHVAVPVMVQAALTVLSFSAAACSLVIGLDRPQLEADAEADADDEEADAQADPDGLEPPPDPVDDPDTTETDGGDPTEDSDAPPDGVVTVTSVFGDTPDSDFPFTVLDTFININDENTCSEDYLYTYTWPTNSIANAAIIKWDLSAIPEGAGVLDAVLELYLCGTEGDGGDDSYTITVHRIINHDPVICSCNGLTYDGANSWTPYTGLYDDIPLAQADIAPAESSVDCDMTLEYKAWDVTSMVSAWVDGREPNFGMLVNADPSAAGDSNRIFCSTDHEEASRRPRLEVTYTVGP